MATQLNRQQQRRPSLRDFNIDPTFSVYKLAMRSMQDTAIMYHRNTMSIISKEVENATIQDGAENMVFASFQFMSRFLPQVERYKQLAPRAHHVYVFGVVDCDLPQIDNLTYVPLKKTDHLVKEWFMVSFGRDYFSALATEELTDLDTPTPDKHFKGVWSFDVFLVGVLYEWLCNTVGLRKEQHLRDQHDYLRHAAILQASMERMRGRIQGPNPAQRSAVEQELSDIVQDRLQPAYSRVREQG